MVSSRDLGRTDQPEVGTTHTLPDGDTLEITAPDHWHSAGFDRIAWRLRDGQPVAMVRFYTPNNTSSPGMAVVCDVEVRDTHRGQHLGLDTIAAISNLAGSPLHTSGNYTPSGYAALAEHLPLTCPTYNDARVSFDEMTFVADWDARTLHH